MHRRPNSLLGLLGYHTADTSTPLRAGTWSAVYGSAQCAVSAADSAAKHGYAYALCRPPGHHAFADSAGGFCYVNNTAVAAQRLRSALQGRIAVIDVDVHHGNGTQGIFYQRADVLTISIHADPTNYFPFYCGYADETGEGEGRGFNLNLPQVHGAGDADFQAALEQALARVVTFAPAGLVVALGLDASEHDPLGVLKVTTTGVRRRRRCDRTTRPPDGDRAGGRLCLSGLAGEPGCVPARVRTILEQIVDRRDLLTLALWSVVSSQAPALADGAAPLQPPSPAVMDQPARPGLNAFIHCSSSFCDERDRAAAMSRKTSSRSSWPSLNFARISRTSARKPMTPFDRRVKARPHQVDVPGAGALRLHRIDEVTQVSLDLGRFLEERHIDDELCACVVPRRGPRLVVDPGGRNVAVRAQCEDLRARIRLQQFEMVVRAREMPREPYESAVRIDLGPHWQQGRTKGLVHAGHDPRERLVRTSCATS